MLTERFVTGNVKIPGFIVLKAMIILMFGYIFM